MKHITFVLCILLIPFYGRAVATQDSLALVALCNNTLVITGHSKQIGSTQLIPAVNGTVLVVNNRVTEITLFQ